MAGLYIMASLYFLAGLTHFRNPRIYQRIMPSWMPLHKFVVYFTGGWEMIASVLLLIGRTREFAAWSIIVLLILVFPANIQMAINFKKRQHKYYWMTLLRLPLQALLLWWAWLYT